jgi:hypothetical protein
MLPPSPDATTSTRMPTSSAWSRALRAWCLLMLIESVHGTLRELLLAPRLGSLPARQLGVFTGAALILLTSVALARWLELRTRRACLATGLAWLLLTVAFEVALGRLVLGLGWARILEDYDPTRGGLMLLGLAVLALAPLVAARARGTLAPAPQERDTGGNAGRRPLDRSR